MKLNGFLALGIVLILLGGVSMLEIVDVTPPLINLGSLVPQKNGNYSSLGFLHLICRDPETSIDRVEFSVWQSGSPATFYNLEFKLKIPEFIRLFKTVWWEVWLREITAIDTPGEYRFHYIVYNKAGLKTEISAPSTFTITESAATPEPPQTASGDLCVIGYYNTLPVNCEVWLSQNGNETEHATITAYGYVWESIAIGDYVVHGIYNGIIAEKSAFVEENQTTIVQLNFGGTQPPTPSYTPPNTDPGKPFDVTLIFMATGGIAIVYGFVKQKKGKT